MDQEAWYFEHNGQRVGPFYRNELAELAKGKILDTSSRLVDALGQTVLLPELLGLGSRVQIVPEANTTDTVGIGSSHGDGEELVTAEIVPASRDLEHLPTDSDSLSLSEFIAYGLAFLFLPILCVLVSSLLYYVWKSSSPWKAQQINLLGFGVFFLHILFGCVLGMLAEGS
ncbi:hypothetical protein C5Y96_09380 [Blastopirellula marina]|uniref:GYF domain-containing protein n=1 Tax=Blastopirellula marina TaxID=124 RepID=A0A2S8FST9_9BACT|nr:MULTISPECIES: DUF4339 domain-containing protein [Pirellulaceae]PQO35243.1 hypothetical protein C5Y96_09380 [Blastopirellula marina]RCS53112.1 DUF4339 domain-containing protein [Bremerella cremea]